MKYVSERKWRSCSANIAEKAPWKDTVWDNMCLSDGGQWTSAQMTLQRNKQLRRLLKNYATCENGSGDWILTWTLHSVLLSFKKIHPYRVCLQEAFRILPPSRWSDSTRGWTNKEIGQLAYTSHNAWKRNCFLSNWSRDFEIKVSRTTFEDAHQPTANQCIGLKLRDECLAKPAWRRIIS